MKCICITGAIQSDLEFVSEIMQRAGMKLSKPAKQDDLIDIVSWHEQALTLDGESLENSPAITNPGRLMEQLAGDIFVANIKSNLWGWADTRSTWMLDYWLNYDPRLYFVLVCVPPQRMLAKAMDAVTELDSVETIMASWQAHYQQVLRFHLRNPQRSLLVDIDECVENPHLLVKRCTEQWKLPITSTDFVAPNPVAHEPLAVYLAQQLCQGYPQSIALQNELVAALTRLKGTEQAISGTQLTPENIIAGYRNLKDRSVENGQLQAAHGELAALKENFDDVVTNYKQQQHDAETKLKEAGKENELLLLQLHQAQEELEANFLKQEALQKQIDVLWDETKTLGQIRDEQMRLAEQHQAKVETLMQERDNHTRQVTDRQKQIEKLTHAYDEQMRLAAERQVKIDQLAKKHEESIATYVLQLKDAETKLKAAVQESDLLLQQLHHVQEEFEQHVLQLQEKQKSLQSFEERWQRMLKRFPGYCDCESIEVLPVEGDGNSTIIWQLKDLNIANRSLPKVEFKTILNQGIAGFVFANQPGIMDIFTRWPTNPANQDDLTLIPTGSGPILEQRIETLLDVATDDWDLLETLALQLQSILEQPSFLKAPVNFNAEPLRAGLAKFRAVIEKFPETLRYDHITLKHEHVIPGYEHLWLRFENLAIGSKRWPVFEFRLSCANINPDHFGDFPHLEFPEENGRIPFQDWFNESYDDFGGKLELRFALPELMDLDVWQRISEVDRKFISDLIVRLPAILSGLQSLGNPLNRPWEDWIKMAKEIQRIFYLRVTLQTAMPSEEQEPTTPKKTVPKKAAETRSSEFRATLTTKTSKAK